MSTVSWYQPTAPGKVIIVLKPLRLVIVAAAAAVLAGCSALAPITTSLDYSAPDGTQVATDSVLAHNLVLVAVEEGGPALLVGSVTNRSAEDATIELSWDGGTATVRLGAGQTVQLNPDHELVQGTAPIGPGLVTDLTVSAHGETTSGPLIVVDGTLPHFAELADQVALTN